MRTIATLDDLVALVDDRPALFVRFSHGPDADRGSPSLDYEADVELPGLSVTPLNPEPWWTRSTLDWVARRVCQYAELAEKDPTRRPWILTGHVAGQGPDHEPLLTDVEPIAWLSTDAIAEALDHYRRAFDKGRDSAD